MRTSPQTHAITLVCAERMRIFQRETNARTAIDTLLRYRSQGRFLLHGFVVMPEHMHLLLTPVTTLERSVGLVKGGISFALRIQYKGPVWQESYYAHRIRDVRDYYGQLEYIARNPERRRYVMYPYVHTSYASVVDDRPGYLSG